MSGKRNHLSDAEIASIIQLQSDSEDEGGIFDESTGDDNDEEVEGGSNQIPSTPLGPNTFKWGKVCCQEGHVYDDYNNIKDFTGRPGVKGFEGLEAYECIEKFFPEEIYDFVSEETVRYSTQKLATLGQLSMNSIFKKWNGVSANEIKAYIALEIGMGLVHKPTLGSYFGKTFWLTRTPGFSTILSKDKYELIRAFQHFCNNDEADAKKDDRLFKFRSILDKVKDICYPLCSKQGTFH